MNQNGRQEVWPIMTKLVLMFFAWSKESINIRLITIGWCKLNILAFLEIAPKLFEFHQGMLSKMHTEFWNNTSMRS